MSLVQAQLFQNNLFDSKSGQGVFELPCGYVDRNGELHTEIVVREMTGKEEDLLAAKKVKASKKMNGLMANCVERLGSITDKGQIAKAIPELLLGDRVALLFAIRRVSFGDTYAVEETCQHCDRTGHFQVDLSDLSVKKMPDPMKRSFIETLPSGRTIKFHMPSGEDEAKVADLATTGLDDLSAFMLMRVDSIDDKKATLDLVQSLPSRDRNALRAVFDEFEGGVDTALDFDCMTCGESFKKDLNIDAGFFFPSLTRKRSKTT